MAGIEGLLKKDKKEEKDKKNKTYQSGIRFTRETHRLLNTIVRHYESEYEKDQEAFKKKHNLTRKPTQNFVINMALPLLAKNIGIKEITK